MVKHKHLLSICILLLFICISGLGYASAGIVVIGHPGLKVDQLSTNQIRELFLGKTSVLPDGTQIKVFDQKDGSAIRDLFYQTATGRTHDQIKAYWAKIVFTGKGLPPEVMKDGREMRERVSATPGAVGYIDEAEVDDKVRILWKP